MCSMVASWKHNELCFFKWWLPFYVEDSIEEYEEEEPTIEDQIEGIEELSKDKNIPNILKDIFPVYLLGYDTHIVIEKVEGTTVTDMYLSEILNENTLI